MSGGAGGYSRAPAHQNSFAFKHNTNSKKTKVIAAIPNVGLCIRCHDIIEWRKKYRKYKPQTKPGKCLECHKPKVKFAYHQLCKECSAAKGVCPKCMKPRELADEEERTRSAIRADIAFLENTKGQIPGMSERERRSALRELYRKAEEFGMEVEDGEEGGAAKSKSRHAAYEAEEGEEEEEEEHAHAHAHAGEGEEAGEEAGEEEAAEEGEEEEDASEDDGEEEEEGEAEEEGSGVPPAAAADTRPVRGAGSSLHEGLRRSEEVGDILTRALATAKARAAAAEGRV